MLVRNNRCSLENTCVVVSGKNSKVTRFVEIKKLENLAGLRYNL
jgi:hypothetical protein